MANFQYVIVIEVLPASCQLRQTCSIIIPLRSTYHRSNELEREKLGSGVGCLPDTYISQLGCRTVRNSACIFLGGDAEHPV